MEEEHRRVIKCIHEIGKRVEFMREQALSIEKEKESLLATLQQIQDNPELAKLPEDQRDDIEYSTERLVVRCLTVDVSVTTPRNENQEAAYKAVVDVLENLHIRVKENPVKCEKEVISHLNACLAEPISNNINLRFQDRILSCTADDQKVFRKRLEDMLEYIQKPPEEERISSTESSSQASVQNGVDTENSVDTSGIDTNNSVDSSQSDTDLSGEMS